MPMPEMTALEKSKGALAATADLDKDNKGDMKVYLDLMDIARTQAMIAQVEALQDIAFQLDEWRHAWMRIN